MAGNNRSRKSKKGHRSSKRPVQRRNRAPAEPSLMDDVRRALRDPNPLNLLSFTSMLLSLSDPRRNHPFAQLSTARPGTVEPEGPTREELVGMFIDVPEPETSALLAVIAELVGDDDLLRARIRRELATRPRIETAWLAELSEAETYRAVRMSHILGDGDNIMLGTRMTGGQEFTSLVYIDHNMGTLVKDAFVLPEPIASIIATYRKMTDDPDTRWDDIELADARACVDPAIELAAITFPPFESDTWPACRALVEWVTRGLPQGGSEYQRPQWTDGQLADLADRFFASADGIPLDDRDHRGLLDSILWYGTDYGPGDPLRWSSVKVEILLEDWMPRKVVAPAEYLALAPDLLRAFIGFSHAEVGLRSELTDEALTAIGQWEPTYQELIRSPGSQGPAAVLASLGIGGDDTDDGPFGFGQDGLGVIQWVMDELARQVGGPDRMDGLDAKPLPDEPFDWDGVPNDVADRVREVLVLVDGCCEEMFDVELRTACRRLLARVASVGPEVFRRKSRDEMSAAAVVWIIGKVNEVFSIYRRGKQVKDLMGHFGLSGSASQRAETMLRTAGFECRTTDLCLGSPDYLVSERRQRMIEVRDECRNHISELDADTADIIDLDR